MNVTPLWEHQNNHPTPKTPPGTVQTKISTQGISPMMDHALKKYQQHLESFDNALLSFIEDKLKTASIGGSQGHRFKIESLNLTNNNETIDAHLKLWPDIHHLQSILLNTINPIADEKGFVVDRIELTGPSEAIHVTIQLSVMDMLGLDRHARLMLSDAEKAGLAPSMLGKRFRIPIRTNNPESVERDIVITGLVDLGQEDYLVRLIDLKNSEPMQARPQVVAALYNRYATR